MKQETSTVKVKTLSLRPYNCSVLAFKGGHNWEAAHAVVKRTLTGLEVEGRTKQGTMIYDKETGVPLAVWVQSTEPSLVAHEASHVAMRLLHQRGVGLCLESEEAFAYLIGAIVADLIDNVGWETCRLK